MTEMGGGHDHDMDDLVRLNQSRESIMRPVGSILDITGRSSKHERPSHQTQIRLQVEVPAAWSARRRSAHYWKGQDLVQIYAYVSVAEPFG